MIGDAFRDWATGQGGLNEASARSYLDYLRGIERHLGADVAADWSATRLQDIRERLERDSGLNPKTRANYLSALTKYQDFRALSGA